MVKLRFARFGRKNLPFYRLVAIQAKTKRQGNAIEYLGTYDPKKSPSEFKINSDRIKYWLSVGAQPTPTVYGLLAKEGLVKPLKKKYAKKPGKNRLAQLEAETAKTNENKAAEEVKTEAPVETQAEAAVEAAPADEKAEESAPEENKAE